MVFGCRMTVIPNMSTGRERGNNVMTTNDETRKLLPDVVEEILDFKRLGDENLLQETLYRCLEMYFSVKGESGLEKVLLMWDDISRRRKSDRDDK